MEKIADLLPLECRREYKAAIQGEKLKRLASHPFHQKLQHGTKKKKKKKKKPNKKQNKTKQNKQTNKQTKNKKQKNRLKRKSFKHKLKNAQKENTNLLEADPGKWKKLTSVWASRKSLPEVKPEILGLAAANGTQAQELQEALTLEIMQDHDPKSTWTLVFSDGYAENAVRNEGSGAYIRRSDGATASLSIPAGDLSSNYRAELPKNTSLRKTATS